MAPVVLVTGCSSGIGRACVERFAAEGWRVVATARRPESIADLASASVTTLPLDVDDAASIARGVSDAAERVGPIDVLVNNAGYGQMGPLLTLTDARLRAQLETNVVGTLAVTRAVLDGPQGMVARRSGRVVMISSIVAHVATPFGGPYSASKFALRALSDSLRLELLPFGIGVVQVEPGPIVSRFGDHAAEKAASLLPAAGSPYEPLRPFVEKRLGASQRNAAPASEAARVVWVAATASRPRARYMVTNQARLMKLAKTLLPDRLLDAILAREFGLGKRLPRS